jgi:hypothetical protein
VPRLQTWQLGVVAAAVVAIAVFVTVANRDSRAGRRDGVATYIKRVDAIQQQLRVPLTNMFHAYRDYASHSARPPQLERELVQAKVTLRKFTRRVTVLPAPAQAEHLRALLVQLGEAEVSAAGEVEQMARFTVAYRTVLTASSDARVALGRALAAVPVPKPRAVRGTPKWIAAARAAYRVSSDRAAADQANAVAAYVVRLATIQRRLRTLHPPAAMAPGYHAELRSLLALRTAGAHLAGELRTANRSHVLELSRQFGAAARLAGTVAAQRAEIAAIRAYNRRVRAIGALQTRVEAEVARLQRTLG